MQYMAIGTRDDIVRLFPGTQDHTVVEVLAMGATIDELEGAMLLLEGNEQELIETRNQAGSRLNLLLQILADSEIQFQDGPET